MAGFNIMLRPRLRHRFIITMGKYQPLLVSRAYEKASDVTRGCHVGVLRSTTQPNINTFCDWLPETIVISVYDSFFRNYISTVRVIVFCCLD